MPDMTDDRSFEELEIELLTKMCDDFRTGKNPRVERRWFGERFQIADYTLAHAMFEKLLAINAIEERYSQHEARRRPRYENSGYYHVISPMVCEIAEQRRAEVQARSQPGDRVDKAYKWARAHPLVSTVIIAFAVFLAIVTTVNQTLGLLEKFSDSEEKPAQAIVSPVEESN